MKVYFRILCISLLGFSHSVFAQFTSVPMTINTPYGAVHSSYMVYTPMYYGNGGGSLKYRFTVKLKNDSVISFKSKMLSEKKKMYIEVKQKKQKIKIFPSDTKSLIGSSSMTYDITGEPADSCWLFLVKKGAIYCYSSVPSNELYSAIAIQEGPASDIVALNKDNLKKMVSDLHDEKITKWLEKGSLIKVIERYNERKLGHP